MTDAELIILSLVAERPQHGYEIQQAIESRALRQWAAIGFSSVYYVLHKLEEEGLLESQSPATRPARQMYTLTEAGRNILQTTVADRLSTPREPGSSFLLGLATLHHLRPEQVRHALDAYETGLQARIAELNQQRQAQLGAGAASPLQTVALVDYSLHLLLAELEWLREFRQAWEAEAPPAPPERPAYRDPVLRSAPTRPASPTRPHNESPAEDETPE